MFGTLLQPNASSLAWALPCLGRGVGCLYSSSSHRRAPSTSRRIRSGSRFAGTDNLNHEPGQHRHKGVIAINELEVG